MYTRDQPFATAGAFTKEVLIGWLVTGRTTTYKAVFFLHIYKDLEITFETLSWSSLGQ